jgi:hypothetical protein
MRGKGFLIGGSPPSWQGWGAKMGVTGPVLGLGLLGNLVGLVAFVGGVLDTAANLGGLG